MLIMKLSHLLAPLGLFCPEDPEITDLTCDSRSVEPGALFVALAGAHANGGDFIPEAAARGAAAVMCAPPAPEGLPAVLTPDPRRVLGPLAAEFFSRPADGMTLIAVTGTKGKTTTAHMIRDILTAAGHKTGMIGTLGAFIGVERLAERTGIPQERGTDIPIPLSGHNNDLIDPVAQLEGKRTPDNHRDTAAHGEMLSVFIAKTHPVSSCQYNRRVEFLWRMLSA